MNVIVKCRNHMGRVRYENIEPEQMVPVCCPAAYAEKEKAPKMTDQRWISVEDRLPDPLSYYYLVYDGVRTTVAIWCPTEVWDLVDANTKKRRFDGGKWDAADDYLRAVTHWMPLPDPPEKEVMPQ